MLEAWYEKDEYQQFLISQERDAYLPKTFYPKLIGPVDKNKNTSVLDFGTGLGYSALSIAAAYQDKPLHIYACDCQEILLDQLWNTITKKKLHQVTPFFLPRYSSIDFPAWLPPMSQIVCSLTLSACENSEEVIQTIHKIAEPGGILHILDWHEENAPDEVKKLMPKGGFLDPEMVEVYLKRHQYHIEKTRLTEKYFFTISAKVPQEGLRESK